MQPRRVFGTAAVCARSVPAGTIESSSGSASVTPVPRRNVRRERCFFVMKLTAVCLHTPVRWTGSQTLLLARRSLASALHLERRALHDAGDERREPVAVQGRVARDRA